MSAENIDIPVHYEQLDDIEDDFDQVDLEILRQQDKMTRDLYAKRDKVVSQIPNFWPLVFESAPLEVDSYVQPNDAVIIVAALKNLVVERFELPDGHPRSFSIKFEFQENEFFEDKAIEKKFWWRYAKDGWSGYVSEPIEIKWKGEDPTGGLLALAKKIYEDDKAGKTGETEHKAKLIEKREATDIDELSFFNFFGFRGRYISEEESREAAKVEDEKRKARKQGKEVEEEMDEDEDEDDEEYEFEIFPTGDELALAIAEDLWPGAIRYFMEGQENAALSDASFEDDDDEEMGEGDEEEDEKPSKKRKA